MEEDRGSRKIWLRAFSLNWELGVKVRLNWVLITLFAPGLSAPAFAADASVLKPPHGAAVAIVMFEVMQCPDCSKAYPVVWEAANAHKIPVVLHDFPLQMHPWSFDAAV